MTRMAFADREFRGIMVGTAREGVEAERAEQHRQHLRVARIFFQMRFGAAHGKFRLALDHCGDDLDMAFFSRRRAGGQFTGLRRHGARLAAFHVELMQPGAPICASAKPGSSAIALSNASSAPCQADSMQSTPSR